MSALAGRVAWITGASRGIGRATALALGRRGASLILCAREEGHLGATIAALEKEGCEPARTFAYDVGDADAIAKAFADVRRDFKRLDILVNNAGILQDALLGMISRAQVEETLRVNLHGVIYHMQYASRIMAHGKAGAIVNVASIIGRFGNAGQAVYAASKAGVIGATQSAAKELAASGVRVNAVAPGLIDTDMIRSIPVPKLEERRAKIGMGRLGTPDDVANVIAFLASDDAAYVTGQVVGVDGAMLV